MTGNPHLCTARFLKDLTSNTIPKNKKSDSEIQNILMALIIFYCYTKKKEKKIVDWQVPQGYLFSFMPLYGQGE